MKEQEKALKHFQGKVVRKDLTAKVKGNAVVPAYVLEYLLGQYCAIDDEEIIKSGIEQVKSVVTNNFVHKADAELVKSVIKERGSHKIIDKVTVTLNERKDIYEASFTNLGVSHIPIADEIVQKHRKLLGGGGVWCILSVMYDVSDNAETRWVIESVKPIQVSGVDSEEFINARKEFSSEEWLNLLMHSIGLNPEYFNRRGKIIQISRLITHVENNYNYVELGPKGTGKSHIFSELSPHGVLISGGDVSSARLFVSNVGKGQVGLVGYWDVVCLDEFEQVKGSKRADGDMVNIMQNYMANKSFNRGKETIQAFASMAFVGNTKRSVPYMLRNSHLFESIPEAYIKGAFLDRIHIYIPGWEVPILKESYFTTEFGFIVDYLAEILREFRKLDYSNLVDEYVELDSSFSGRDKMAVRKTFSGLVKLIYPDKRLTKDEAFELINFAVEGRKRVKDQLYVLDESFRDHPVEFRYKRLTDGEKVEVETLEKNNLEVLQKLHKVESEGITNESPSHLHSVALSAGIVSIRDNQTGISYQGLFGNYLSGVRKIKLTDPYIRLHYQFRNLMEFCMMLSRIKSPEEETELHLLTWNEESKIQESERNLYELQIAAGEIGVQFTWEFEDRHDRSIITDHGWQIVLGRGLDIFEPMEGKFDMGHLTQERRKCKNCDITFVKNN